MPTTKAARKIVATWKPAPDKAGDTKGRFGRAYLRVREGWGEPGQVFWFATIPSTSNWGHCPSHYASGETDTVEKGKALCVTAAKSFLGIAEGGE